MVILVKALQVILALSILIFVHELGHFLWARIFGIRVDKFYLFFDIGGHKIASWKWGETEFGIGWLPLGGYCKISGMVDESMDLDQLGREPKPWEYRAHPAWHRLLVTAGGILDNIIFAILCYIGIMAVWGDAYIANEGTQIYVNELSYELGFRNGDEILRMDDYVPENFAMLQADLARRDVRKVTVLRDADTVDIYIDQAYISEILNSPLMFDIALPFVIDQVSEDGPNAGADLRHGDRVTAFGGRSVRFLQDSRGILDSLRSSAVPATIVRGADTLDVDVQVDSAGRVGVSLVSPDIRRHKYSILSAVPAGWKRTWETVGGYLQDLKLLARPSTGAYKSVGSFIAIGQVFPSSWDWYQFINILALLSVVLAVMNLIPIPGLDGGHILFTLYEMISGRKPGEKFLIAAQMVGMILIIGLMILAFGNDIGRLIP